MMEKHKLIPILLKDLRELNELASGFENNSGYSKLELDIALSKAKLVHQEFELLKSLDSRTAENEAASPVIVPTPKDIKPSMEEKIRTKIVAYEKVEEQIEVEEEPLASSIEEAGPIAENAEPLTEEKVVDEPVDEDQEIEELSREINEEESEEELVSNKTVGEHFAPNKSLNDLMIENKTLDKKLASSPIEKLDVAIGLNDRFQYTRELFNNDPELFRQTIHQIDQSKNLNEAVDYLNTNFKWEKTDTSVHFAQLIKRRFSN